MCCLFAAGCRTTGVEIIEHGIYAARQSGKEATDGTTRGERVLLRDITLLEKTTTIPGTVGTRFGFYYSLTGSRGNDLDATIRIIHPATRNPKTRKETTVETWTQKCRVGMPHYAGFTFDEEWEIAPGEWKIQVLDNKRLLAEKVFLVK